MLNVKEKDYCVIELTVYHRVFCRFYPKQSLNIPDNVPIYASIKLIEYAC